ncbi:MAG: ATP-NAD kinase family protein [Bacillota bacterium]
MKKIGLIVNPIAGIGGKVGLKGSDGRETQEKAKELGAEPVSPHRTVQALTTLKNSNKEIELITYPKEMGENEAREAGFKPTVIGEIESGSTTPADTQQAAKDLKDEGVELLLFSGGDGTARDIYTAIETSLPVLGIPAGVKIHSAVFATNPRAAGDLARKYLQGEVSGTEKKEVMDIDEEAFRYGQVDAQLYGYLTVPSDQSLTQDQKSGSARSDEISRYAIAEHFLENRMKDNCLYILGPGTTTASVLELLELEHSLLGVDAIFNRKLVGKDLAEQNILALLEEYKEHPAEIVITVIGGQGFIFGRGNQQISPQVIRKVGLNNITILATSAKLHALSGKMLIDTGDPELDENLTGYYHVISDYKHETVMKAE